MLLANSLRKNLPLVLTLLLSVSQQSTPACASGGVRTVALSGSAVPEVGPGVIFDGPVPFSWPAINGRGQVVFRGFFEEVDGTTGGGVFVETGGSGRELVTHSGEPPPGIDPGLEFRCCGIPLINDRGQVAFVTTFIGAGAHYTKAIFSEGSGSGLALVAREGDTAPGLGPGVNFSDFFSPVFNAGQMAFEAELTGTGVDDTNDAAIFSERGGSGLTLLAREGNAAPGTGPGVNYRGFSPGSPSVVGGPALNARGQTAFKAFLTGTGVDDTNDTGIFSEGDGNGLALVARTGDPVPGLGPGVNYAGFGNVALNNSGQAAFQAFLTGTGVDDTNNSGIFREGGGEGLELLVREGDAAPGIGPGVSFGGLGGRVVLNGRGQTAFLAGLRGTGVDASNSIGLFTAGGGSVPDLVARKGHPAPGTGPGVNFSGLFGSPRLFGGPMLNGRGQTAFFAGLEGTGVDQTNYSGIFAVDQAGDLQLIVRRGDLLDVSDDPLAPDLRTISRLQRHLGISVSENFWVSGNEDGRRSSISDLGHVVFWAEFTDGSSGIFVSDRVAVPEPNSVALLALVGFVLFVFHRRQNLRTPLSEGDL